MNLIKDVIYEKVMPEYVILDINQLLIKEQQRSENEDYDFDYYVEMYETKSVVVFANFYNMRDYEGEPIFQVETATLDKLTNIITYHVDNDGFILPCRVIKEKPLFTKSELEKRFKFEDMGSGYKYGDLKWH